MDSNYKVNEDLEVMRIIDESELSPYSVATYHTVIKEFCRCNNKTYYDIVREVKELQRDKIVNGTEIIPYNPNDSVIMDYIQNYQHYLTQRGNKKSSITTKIKTLLIVLRKSNIKTPKLTFKKEPQQKRVQLITTDDIRFILNHCTLHHKALITFMASTGVRRYDVVNTFKIEDFIEACSDYTDAVFLDDFLEDAPQDMVPYFEFIPNKTANSGLPCKVCCSSEASNLILESLKARVKSVEKRNEIHGTDLVLDEESPLFSSKQKYYVGKYCETTITVVFAKKNQLLIKEKEKELDNQLRNHEISKKEWRMKKENFPRFHPHSLRHRFISTVRAHTTNRDISLLMEGHASSIATDKFYVGESEELFNKETIRETYLQVMPYLTFFQNVDPVTYQQYKQETDRLQKELDILKEKMGKYEATDKYLDRNSVLNDLE